MSTISEIQPIQRLSRDLAASATTLGESEARFLVDYYYIVQDDRKRAANQKRALSENGEPHQVLAWLFDQSEVLEKQIARALDKYSAADPLGEWARGIIGIGPVIAAGLLAHIDLEKAPTAGAVWRFAGLDPSLKWDKGQKRPFNAELKTLCWKIGESFVKVSGNEDSFYGRIYRERKAQEEAANAKGEFSAQAARKLEQFKIGKSTDAYKHYSEGRLPPAHIHARAKRMAVKLFLSHYHEMGFRLKLGREAPEPYVIAHQGHVHRYPADMAK